MASTSKAPKQDIWDALAEAFNPEDFKELIKTASASTRLNAYINIVKLLTYRTKTNGEVGNQGEVEKLLEGMFTKSKD